METDQQPSVPDDNTNAIPGLVGVSLLFAVALMAYGVRIYSRVRSSARLTVPDYVITIALLSELITFVSLLVAIHFGLGRYDYYLSPADFVKIMKCLSALGFIAFWASSLARVAIGGMLLRFSISKAWRIVIWALILIQFAMAIGADIFQLLQCRPIRAMWEPVPDAQWMGIASDLVFAIMPVFIIWPMHRPVMERVLVIVLMALGTIAAVAGAMKLVYSSAWDPRRNILRDWMPLLWWYRVEEIGLITAACAPFLKPLIERMLGRFGVPQFRFVTIILRTIRSSPADTSKEVKESTSSKQRTTDEKRLAPRNPDELPSFVSANSFDYRSNGLRPHGELVSDQV
ncbi:hypothetical protein DL770_003910 [Monosporascus sp. CRB-9-2]|nr:hypothetical protein DL770_003910 [Monosporascus sp. CRB-9-2]